MEYEQNTYSSFDLMKIFGIKKGSWQSIKKKFSLDNYSQTVFDSKQNQNKFLYNQEAYNILRDNYKIKISEEIKENPQMLALISENTTLRATIEEYKNLNIKFETMYNNEKDTKEELIRENTALQVTNGNYIEKNHNLEKEKHYLQESNNQLEKKNNILQEQMDQLEREKKSLQEEMNRIKNRSFFARLFNK